MIDSYKPSPAELEREDRMAKLRLGIDRGIMPDLVDVARLAKANDALMPMLERANRYGQQKLQVQMREEEAERIGAS